MLLIVEHGVLTVGTLEHAELRRLFSVIAELKILAVCLLALRVGAHGDAQLIGTAEGFPPTADVVLALLQAGADGPERTAHGWAAPVILDGRVVGVLLVDGVNRPGLRPQAALLAETVSEILAAPASDVDTARALRALVDVGEQIHSAEVDADTRAVLELVVQHAHELIGADVTWLALADHSRNESRVTVSQGARTAALTEMSVTLGQGITGLALSAMAVVTLDDSYHADARIPDHVHNCLRDEGIATLACAPMFHQAQLTGNLLVGFRRHASVPRDAQYLLSALSGQAATAIANSRLYASLRETNALLERHAALSKTLTAASLSGGDKHVIAGEIARAIGRDVIVQYRTDSVSTWRYSAAPGDSSTALGESVRIVDSDQGAAIKAGGELLGHVLLAEPSPGDEFARTALSLGATSIALELTKEQAALEAEWRMRGELLEELLQAGDQWSDSLRRRAAHAGINVESPRVLALVEALPGADLAAVFAMFRAAGTAAGILVGRRGDLLLVAVSEQRQPREWLQSMLGRALAKSITLRAGMSAPHIDLRRALREASGALKLAQNNTQNGVIVCADALGPLRFLMDAPDTSEMRRLVQANLKSLVDYDKRRRSDLFGTVRTFLDAGGNHPLTARRCNVHLNTVKYRLNRANEVLCRDLSDPASRFELSLAFAVLDVLDAIGVDSLSEGDR